MVGESIFIKGVVPAIVKESIGRFFEWMKKEKITPVQSKEDYSSQLSGHLIEILRWSERIQMFGMTKPKDTSKDTIPLNISTTLKKLSAKFLDTSEEISEMEIVTDPDNYIIMGEPGAGKSTTLKRIARLVLLDGEKNEFTYNYPLLIILKDLQHGESLYKKIAEKIGIEYKEDTENVLLLNKENKIKSKEKIIFENFISYGGNQNVIDSKISHSTKIGKRLIEDALPDLLNSLGIVLLLDGLDEIPEEYKDEVISEIESLARKLDTAKIILTARTSEYKAISGFSICQIKPLTSQQIYAISKAWIKNADGFIAEVNTKAYRDLVDRPLFLCFLLVIYNNSESLPLQAYNIYEEIISLLLREWDKERKIPRISKYADFGTEKKIKFLSELSFRLTYKRKTKSFDSKDLKEIYDEIYKMFMLPKDQALDVINEIESHNGLIVEAHSKKFEFSHLSLQEYLCAYNIVMQPLTTKIIDYFTEYPEPLAIAIALSTRPSEWFSVLILKYERELLAKRKIKDDQVYKLLHRIRIEQPRFTKSVELGLTLLYLLKIFENNSKILEEIQELIKVEEVKASVNESLRYYDVGKKESQDYVLRRNGKHFSSFYEAPKTENLRLNKILYLDVIG